MVRHLGFLNVFGVPVVSPGKTQEEKEPVQVRGRWFACYSIYGFPEASLLSHPFQLSSLPSPPRHFLLATP